MQNPFRNRGQDDFGQRQEREPWDRRHEASGRRDDESRTWRDDAAHERDADFDRSSSRFGGRDDYRARPGHDAGYRQGGWSQSDDWGREQTRGWDSAPGYGRSDHRADRHQDHGFGQGRYVDRTARVDNPAHAYAPGSQIWDDRDERSARRSRQDFEPDYLHWRDQQIASFDRDYHAWRDEKRQKFSSDFDTWRSTRPQNETKNPSPNAWVGDVSDGGVADVDEKKTRS